MNSTNSTELVRLSKLMTERGLCSRREADALIEKGQVYVNGEKIQVLGTRVRPDCRITMDTQALKLQKNLISIILNKPIGVVSNMPERGYPEAKELITLERYHSVDSKDTNREILPNIFWKQLQTHYKSLSVIGRLDIDSQGLLILSQDGRLVKSIIGEETCVEKEYLVRVRGDLSSEQLGLLNEGLELDGKKLKKACVEWLNQDQLRFVLTEGKKRQIRRMCELVGLQVVGLKRVRIGKLTLGSLPEGCWRLMSDSEKKLFLGAK